MESSESHLLTTLAARLTAAIGDPVLVVPERERRASLLRAARDIAHASERQNAPLATYLVGRFVAARVAAGLQEDSAVAEAARIVDEVTAGSG